MDFGVESQNPENLEGLYFFSAPRRVSGFVASGLRRGLSELTRPWHVHGSRTTRGQMGVLRGQEGRSRVHM